MFETSKTRAVRQPDFHDIYLKGKGIDIGCGGDLVSETAEPFDMEHGNAQHILQYKHANCYDYVHSSHCLEHMTDPQKALADWWALLKPNGYLILVVPDEDLYEQGNWPSKYNADHKVTFTIKQKKSSWSPVSLNIKQLVKELPFAKILSAEIHDQGYDHELFEIPKNKLAHKMNVWCHVRKNPLKRKLAQFILARYSLRSDFYHRNSTHPIDQSLGKALCQIQIIAQKQR